MEILLLSDIPGVGRKNDLVIVGDGFALNCLLPERKGLVATPNVRRRYAEEIKRRAEEKQHEAEVRKSALSAVSGKQITLARKTTKTGKLYAAITAAHIADAVKSEYGIDLPATSIEVPDHLKTTGEHTVMLSVGGDTTPLKVTIVAEVTK